MVYSCGILVQWRAQFHKRILTLNGAGSSAKDLRNKIGYLLTYDLVIVIVIDAFSGLLNQVQSKNSRIEANQQFIPCTIFLLSLYKIKIVRTTETYSQGSRSSRSIKFYEDSTMTTRRRSILSPSHLPGLPSLLKA